MNNYMKDKHSESIAKAIQVPYRPQQIFQKAWLLQKQIKGAQTIPDMYYVDTNESKKIQIIIL